MSYEIWREIAQEITENAEADAALYEEADRVADLYNMGESDGRRHRLPLHPDSLIYWEAYCQGLRQFWFKKLKLSMPKEI